MTSLPFTLAHPAAVLPLVRRRWVDATCLVIGSMSPDFEYFLHAARYHGFGHTWLGLFVWCLPVTLASAAIFHALILPALLCAAPEALARRFANTRWRLSLASIPCALIGATTHLVWDGFTHVGSGWWWHEYPNVFGHELVLPIVGPTHVVRVLWYGSTIIGFAIVAIYVARAVARRPVVELPPTPRTGPRAIFAACIAVGVTLLVGRAIVALHGTLDILVIATMSGVIAGTLVASVILLAKRSRVTPWR
jgi:hypothetical protein